jgi:hypothetical protein
MKRLKWIVFPALILICGAGVWLWRHAQIDQFRRVEADQKGQLPHDLDSTNRDIYLAAVARIPTDLGFRTHG